MGTLAGMMQWFPTGWAHYLVGGVFIGLGVAWLFLAALAMLCTANAEHRATLPYSFARDAAIFDAIEAHFRAAGCVALDIDVVELREELPAFYARLGVRQS